MPWSDRLGWRETSVRNPDSWLLVGFDTAVALGTSPNKTPETPLTTSIQILARMILSTFKISRSHELFGSDFTLHELGFSTAAA